MTAYSKHQALIPYEQDLGNVAFPKIGLSHLTRLQKDVVYEFRREKTMSKNKMKAKLTLLFAAALISTLAYAQKIRISTAYKIGEIDSTGEKCIYPKEKTECDISIIEDRVEDDRYIYISYNGGDGDAMMITATIDTVLYENQYVQKNDAISSAYYCTDWNNEKFKLIRVVFNSGEEQIIWVYETQAYLYFVYKKDQQGIHSVDEEDE
jgi:hypothetical protein